MDKFATKKYILRTEINEHAVAAFALSVSRFLMYHTVLI